MKRKKDGGGGAIGAEGATQTRRRAKYQRNGSKGEELISEAGKSVGDRRKLCSSQSPVQRRKPAKWRGQKEEGAVCLKLASVCEALTNSASIRQKMPETMSDREKLNVWRREQQ